MIQQVTPANMLNKEMWSPSVFLSDKSFGPAAQSDSTLGDYKPK